MTLERSPCIIPACRLPGSLRSDCELVLCKRHYDKRRRGKSIEQILVEETSPGRPLGSLNPFPVRISNDARSRLKKNARALGFPSAYKLGSHILESWKPPEK